MLFEQGTLALITLKKEKKRKRKDDKRLPTIL